MVGIVKLSPTLHHTQSWGLVLSIGWLLLFSVHTLEVRYAGQLNKQQKDK